MVRRETILATAAATGMLLALPGRLIAQAAAPAPAASTPPATAATPAKVVDPAVILRGTTSTQAERDEAARRLVQIDDAAAQAALAAALQDIANRPGQLAAARALQADATPDRQLLIPLFALIGTGPDNLTDAAIGALGNYQTDAEVMARLLDFATDPQHQQKLVTRLAAIKAVGTMSDKSAVRALVDIVESDAEPGAVRAAAAAALTEMTGETAGQDAAKWRKWWDQNGRKSDAAFENDLLQSRSARLTLLERRFNRVVDESQRMLTDAYQSAPDDKARTAILLRYLKGNEPETRLVGVELIKDDFKNNRTIPAAAREQLRAMVGDSSSQVRVTVAKALTLLNDPGAVASVLAQLEREPDADVRAALAETLAPTRDLTVVDPLLKLLHDPSTHVAEVAAEGLRDLGPQIQKDRKLSDRVARELQATLESYGTTPGIAPLRASLVDAMGSLQNPELRTVYTRLLRPSEASLVRQAALRALGKIEQPWAAGIIVNSLNDSDDAVRLEAINALETTANFSQAEQLYEVVKNTQEKPQTRLRAWEVLRNLFHDDTAGSDALFKWADRFKEEPDRQTEIWEVLRDRFTREKNERDLATVQQNIGEDKMKLAGTALASGDADTARTHAEQAEKYFDLALQYYNNHPEIPAMVTSAVLERRMDALLSSKQYAKAAQFAAESITRNASNQESMGQKLRNEIDRLRTTKQYPDAIQLIGAVHQMTPALAEPFASSINTIEADVKQKASGTQGPQSAVGSGL